MQVKDLMSEGVAIANPQESVKEVAKRMQEANVGSMPVFGVDRLVGMLTDRDITIRVVAEGLLPEQVKVGDIMSANVEYCFEDDSVEVAAQKMSELQIRRLPVSTREGKLIGLISLDDLTRKPEEHRQAGEALGEISRPS